MPYPLSMQMQAKQAQNLKQIQRMIMSPQMQQAIHLLQMPIMELTVAIEAELEQNPVLENEEDNPEEDLQIESLEDESEEELQDIEDQPEKSLDFDERDFEILKRLDEDFRECFDESGNYSPKRSQEDDKLKAFMESSLCNSISLFDHLMEQAHEEFETEDELRIAEVIIGNLEPSGFLSTSLKEIADLEHFTIDRVKSVLETIQTFDPPGIGAQDTRTALLIQLRFYKKEKSIAYKIVDTCYDDLLNNRIILIVKKLSSSLQEVQTAIEQDIARLNLHPGVWQRANDPTQAIVPDVTIKEEDDKLFVVVHDDRLPSLRLNHRYLKMLEDETLPAETKDFIKQKILSAKWLMRNIFQRNDTIERIANSLIEKHADFFRSPTGKLTPLTMKTLSEELNLHESTVARAVSNKYLSYDRGVFPLRYFFSNSFQTTQGEEISSNTVRDALFEIIQKENKRKPLSDQALSNELNARGIPCARRTVAKYRAEFQIGNALQRKKF